MSPNPAAGVAIGVVMRMGRELKNSEWQGALANLTPERETGSTGNQSQEAQDPEQAKAETSG
jgi:hypothetical protein